MLCLLLQLGGAQYAIDAQQIVEVLPLVDIKDVPHAPAGVLGLFNYHGAAVPVVDLVARTSGGRAERRLHSRIVVVRDRDGADGGPRLLGLLVEHATGTMTCAAASLAEPGVAGAAWLGPVAQHRGRVVQLIDPALVAAATFQRGSTGAGRGEGGLTRD